MGGWLSGRALPSHGRGHKFESCTAHHSSDLLTTSQELPRSESYLPLQKVSKTYNIAPSTLTLWCEQGKVQAFTEPYGTKTRYLIDVESLERHLSTKKKRRGDTNDQLDDLAGKLFERFNKLMGHQGENDSAKISSCASYGELIRSVEPWRRSMEHGLIGGKPFSPFTVKYYSFYIDKFLKKHKELSLTSLKKELLSIPVEQYGKRDKLYKAVVCFAKYLINEKALNPYFLNEIKPLQPKRHKPPKRTSINEVELDALLAHCQTIRQYTTVLFLAATGLRASEFCNLQWDDVNLEEGYLVVRCGKGGKRRKVGFGEKVAKALRQYRDFCIQEHGLRENVFLSRYGEKTDRHGLRSVLGKLGKRAGVEVTPHVLRRAFITHNANKGKPLNMLQIAAGHSDIKTTMKYCRTTEDEVVEMMKGWD